MHDRFEIASRRGVGEDDRAELLPIDGAVGVEHVAPKRSAMAAVASVPGAVTPCASSSASRHGTPRRAKLLEDVALAGRDAAGQCDLSIMWLTLREPSRRGCARSRYLRRANRVLQQHRDRQRADAAGHRRQRAGDLLDVGMHVAEHQRARAARTPSRRFEPGREQALDDAAVRRRAWCRRR